MPIGTVYKMPMTKKTALSPRIEEAQRALPGGTPTSETGQAPRSASAGEGSGWGSSSAGAPTPLGARTLYNPGSLGGTHADEDPYAAAGTSGEEGEDPQAAVSPGGARDRPQARGVPHRAVAGSGTPDMAARTQSYDMAGGAPRTGVDPVVRPYVPQHQQARTQSRSGIHHPNSAGPAPPKRSGMSAAAPSPAQEAASVAQRMNGGVINTGPSSHRDSGGSMPGTTSPAGFARHSNSATTPSSHHATSGTGHSMRGLCRILILYHSTYGHIKIMADAVAAGINSVEGCSAVLYQVPETLTEERLRKMNAPPRATDPTLEYEEMNSVLQEVSGIIFGIPTRFGMMPSQMKAWFDSTSKLWTKGHLVGKPAGCFFSTAVQGGGQETTALTTVTQFTHHGMVFVPPGYSFGGRMFDNSEVHGGSPYGAGCIAGGDGSRLPSRFELDYARHQGMQFATVAMKLSRD